MGCTSSAPNMANSSTAEKSIQFENEMSDSQSKDTEEIIYRSGVDRTINDITVLPSCDTIAEKIDVVRNKSTTSFKPETDYHKDDQYRENNDTNDVPKEEEKKPKLEEVVEKVVELHHAENNVDLSNMINKEVESKSDDHPSENYYKTESQLDDATEEHEKQEEKVKVETEISERAEEATSPSQSESSRATRWEALADIAAELPPSLTVDPITGQIYAVSK